MFSLATTLRGVVGAQIWRLYRNSIVAGLVVIAIECACYIVTVPLLVALLHGDRDTTQNWILVLLVLLGVLVAAREVLRRQQVRSNFSTTPILLERTLARMDAVPADWWTSQRRSEFVHLVFPGSAMLNPVAAVLDLARSIAVPLTVWVVVLTIDWRPAAVMLALLPVLWWVHTTAARTQRAVQAQDHAVEIEVQSRIAEFAHQQAALRTSGSARGARRLIDQALADLRATSDRTVARELGSLVGAKTAVNVALAVVVAAVAWAWETSSVSGAVAAATAVLAVRFFDPIADIGGNLRSVRTTLQTAQQLVTFTAAPQLSVPQNPRQMSDTEPVGIDLAGTRFCYRGADRDTVSGIDLHIPSGSFTAIVGPTGAGKTTLVSLLQRMVDPTEGTIKLAGFDMREFALRDLSRLIGYVPQSGHLHKGTLRDHVLLGRPDATQDQLNEAAALVALDEVIDRLPDGWHTDVGDSGAALSGGERQRAHLARVTLQNPPVIILDEATSALDPVTENVVVRWIESHRGQRTVIVVAHNLHTIVGADQIVVLDAGRIVQQGTHQQLRSTHGRYSTLWNKSLVASGEPV